MKSLLKKNHCFHEKIKASWTGPTGAWKVLAVAWLKWRWVQSTLEKVCTMFTILTFLQHFEQRKCIPGITMSFFKSVEVCYLELLKFASTNLHCGWQSAKQTFTLHIGLKITPKVAFYERSELNSEENWLFCLQNRPSFGKRQLLSAPFLANQNKNKRRQNSNIF